ncbi:glycine oxidase ThiO [Bacillus sp. RO3]|nr:glycine oxidase ThiO [Bacillus sp. RO3]
MVKTYDVLIVGGGVIGCSIAYQLCKRGRSVLLLERNQLGGKASQAAAGMLGVQTELHGGSPLYKLAKASRDMYPGLAEELKELTGIDIQYVENGMIKLAKTEEDAKGLLELTSIAEKEEGLEWLSPGSLSFYEPHLSKDMTGGLWIPKDGNISAPMIVQGLGFAAVRLGAEIKEFTDVHDFIIKGNRIEGVQTSAGPFSAKETVIAGGAWSQSLLTKLNVPFQSYPVKGECFSVKASPRMVKRTIFTEDCYIVPKMGGRLLIGATEKSHTFDETISIDGLMHLMKLATGILPDLSYAEWEKAWSGIRPQTEGGMPFIGRSEEWDGLSVATGHYRNGILLAPITGELVADMIEKDIPYPLAEYRRG